MNFLLFFNEVECNVSNPRDLLCNVQHDPNKQQSNSITFDYELEVL
jgi:hypothetical protein